MTIVQYPFPTLKSTPHGLVCGCDMCYDENKSLPAKQIGPHDLHCVCYPCISFWRNTQAYDEALDARYPESGSEEQYLTQDQINLIWESYQNSEYASPSTSPTNEDMHAYNGNLSHQHHHGNGSFLRAAARGLTHLGDSDDRRATLMLGQAGLAPAGLLYTSFQNMAKPLAELGDQIFGKKGPSNKEMHSYNGNPNKEFKKLDTSIVPGDGMPGGYKPPKVTDPRDNGVRKGNTWPKKPAPKTQPAPDIHVIPKQPPRKVIPPYFPNEETRIVPDPHHGNQILPINAHSQNEMLEELGHSGPSNREMHAVNGNIKIRAQGPMTKAQYDRSQRRKEKKKFKKGIVVNVKNTIAKSNNKRKGTKTHIEKIEKRIARRYAAFLKQPVYPPPRLGSTGSAPTKLLHGWFKQTFSMAAPGVGSNSTITNCTDLIAYLSPKFFKQFTSVTDFGCPITIGFAKDSSTTFDLTSGNSTLATYDFSNVTPLQNECGNPSSSVPGPMARWLGGSVSFECRCPMSTTAPPFVFGGLLPNQGSTGALNNSANTGTQLNRLSTTSIRNLQGVVEMNTFDATSVYVPTDPNSLQFDSMLAINTPATSFRTSAIPYIGMSGCPTTATVTVMVSYWIEIQQNSVNANYASGWQKGPKVSSEDVFDNLPRFKTIFPKVVNLGAKGSAASVTGMLATLAPKPKVEDVHNRLELLTKQISDLRLLIEDEEDEKYISTSQPDTPVNQNLSRSTIDLALALRDRLTPGSVTSKTAKTSAA